MLNQDAVSKKLYNLLLSRSIVPETLEADGRTSENPGDAAVFRFDFTAESGKNYGTVVIVLDNTALSVYYSDNIGRRFEDKDKQDWFNFLHQLKQFSTRHFLTFDIRNVNRMQFDLKNHQSISESWQGTRRESYYGEEKGAKLMIKHSRALTETDARFRLIETLWIITEEGERFKLPFKTLAAGRAMLQHVKHGGRPYDERGEAITEMAQDILVLSRFNQANRTRIFEDSALLQLVESVRSRHKELKETMRHLATARGYERYFESWSNVKNTDHLNLIEDLREKFITHSLDPRIELALPLMAKIQQENKMKEVKMFESWVNYLSEGTWAFPDTPKKQKQLLDIMSKPLIAGSDGTNATQELYNVFGDDRLFDAIEDIATTDPDSDVRSAVIIRLQHFADDPAVQALLRQINLQNSIQSTEPESDQEVDVDVDAEETPVAEEYKYSRDLEGILKHAGVATPRDPESDQQEPAVDYEVSNYDKIDEAVQSFIVTAEPAEGGLKKFRVHASTEKAACEKFSQHHSQAKIVSCEPEHVAENRSIAAPVHDPEFSRLKTLAGFELVR